MPQILSSLTTKCAGLLTLSTFPWLLAWPAAPVPTVNVRNDVVASPVVVAAPDGSFESVSGPANPPSPPYYSDLSNSTLLGWDFGPESGIAHRLSSFFYPSPQALLGDRAAYLSGAQSTLASTVLGLSAGSWRVRYKLARGTPAAGSVNEPFLEVLIDGVRVALEAPRNNSVAEFDTRVAIVPAGLATARVEFRRVGDPATGAAAPGTVLIDDVRFEKVPDWSNPGIWSENRVPLATDTARVPAGKVVAVSGIRVCDSIDIQGQVLALPRNGGLTVSWIAVTGSGARLEVGREHVPFQQSFVIELAGPTSASHGYPAGENFLMAMNQGVVDLHGAPRTSWTRLAAGAAVGASQFRVADATGWQIGDELVVTGSTLDRDPTAPTNGWIDYAEKVQIHTITAVNGPSGVIGYDIAFAPTPTAPGARAQLLYRHLGGTSAVTTLAVAGGPAGVPAQLDQTAEVANLSRNVRVQGNVSASTPLPNGERHGGHVMIMHCPMCTGGGGKGRFSYAEFLRLGQETEMGRYPIHFHMLTDGGKGCFVRGCSIHETFNRAITVHGTDSVIVDRNVGYRVNGHAMFLEDGSEMFNRITGNLMISVLRPAAGMETIPSDNSMIDFRDRSPSAYWITNPYNVIRDNIAAGTVGSGFWMIPVRRVLGLSAGNAGLLGRAAAIKLPFPLEPDGLTSFRDNRAHGCGLGFDFNDTVPDPFFGLGPSEPHREGVKKTQPWKPSVPNVPGNPNEPIESGTANRTPVRQTALDCVAYGCKSGVYSSTGGDQVIFERLVVADCEIGIDFAAYHEIRQSALVEQAAYLYANFTSGGPNEGKSGVMLYDGATRVVDSVIRGFPRGGVSNAIHARGAAANHPNHAFKNVHFTAVPRLNWAVVPQSLGTLGPAVGLADTYPNVQVRMGNVADVQNLLNPSKTGAVIFDEDGSITGRTGVSLLWDQYFHRTHHPMEVPFGTGNVLRSPHRFAHLRLVYKAGPVELNLTHDVLYYRTRRTYGTPPSWPASDRGLEDAYLGRQHKQVPIIVGMAGAQTTLLSPPGGGTPVPVTDHFAYTIDHLDTGFLTGPNMPLEITIDDALPGDVAYLRLADLDGKTANQIEARHLINDAVLPEYADFYQFMASNEPALWIEQSGNSTKIHLRIVVRTAAAGSLPAGARSYTAPPNDYADSTNLADSRWRNETVRVSW